MNTIRMRELADRLCANIVTGEDWPNTDDEVLRLNCARALRGAAAAIEAQGEAVASDPVTDSASFRSMGDVQRLQIKPGDKLVVHLDDHLSEAELKIHQRFLEDILGAKCILLPKGTRLAGAISEVAAHTAMGDGANG
jgi:hypothetical protein